MVEFFEFIIDNWEVLKTNWKLFAVFSLLYLVCCVGIFKWIYSHRYKDLPEKQKLQAEIESLRTQIQDLTERNRALTEENRSLRENDRFLKGTSVPDRTPSLGEKISASLSE